MGNYLGPYITPTKLKDIYSATKFLISRTRDSRGALLHILQAYLWLVGNGRMVVMVLIIVPIPPFPTNQR